MPKLKLLSTNCHAITTGFGWDAFDDTYFLVFVAGPRQPTLSYISLSTYFAGWSEGQTKEWADVNSNAVVLVAAIEQDYGRDLSGKVGAMGAWLASMFNLFKAKGATTDQLATHMKALLLFQLAIRLENDDLIGVERCRPRGVGETFGPDFPLVGDGGVYTATFRLVS